MEIKVEKLSPLECAEIISWFLDDGSWEQQIRDSFKGLGKNPTKTDIACAVEKRTKPQEETYEKNIKEFLDWWKTNGIFDTEELAKIIGTTLPKNQDITLQVGDTVICPRDVEKWSYVMSAGFWKWDAINVSLHEITHFVWFKKVKELEGIKHFNQRQDDETYLPYWYLSEIVIDPILNSTSFAKKYEMTWKSYPEFYDINIKNKNLMGYVKELWNTRKSFEDFYGKSSKFVYGNWRDIEKQYLNFSSSPQQKEKER